MTLYEPKFLVTDETAWKEARSKYITSTDVAAILGLDKYKSGNQVRQTKIHGPEEPAEGAQVYFDLGHKWEPTVIEYGMKHLGLENKLLHTQGFYTLEKARLAATPDAVFNNGILIEAKCTGRKNLNYWKAEPPIKYVIQAQVQLMVTNATKCYLVALFFEPWPDGEPKPTAGIIYEIRKNAKLQKKILDKVSKFWDTINIEKHRYIVPSFDKEESTKMTQETYSLLRTEEFAEFKPANAISENDLQIIRQVALEASLIYNSNNLSANFLVSDAKRFLAAYLDAVNAYAELGKFDPLSKNVLIALQSAMKRVAAMQSVDFTDAAKTMVQFANFTLHGE